MSFTLRLCIKAPHAHRTHVLFVYSPFPCQHGRVEITFQTACFRLGHPIYRGGGGSGELVEERTAALDTLEQFTTAVHGENVVECGV